MKGEGRGLLTPLFSMSRRELFTWTHFEDKAWNGSSHELERTDKWNRGGGKKAGWWGRHTRKVRTWWFRLTQVAVSVAWNKSNLRQQLSVTSRRTNISMPFTLKDKNTLEPNHSFISQLQREPLITLSGHYQASIMGVTSVQCSHWCSGSPNPRGFESGADGMGRTLQTGPAYNRD